MSRRRCHCLFLSHDVCRIQSTIHCGTGRVLASKPTTFSSLRLPSVIEQHQLLSVFVLPLQIGLVRYSYIADRLSLIWVTRVFIKVDSVVTGAGGSCHWTWQYASALLSVLQSTNGNGREHADVEWKFVTVTREETNSNINNPGVIRLSQIIYGPSGLWCRP